MIAAGDVQLSTSNITNVSKSALTQFYTIRDTKFVLIPFDKRQGGEANHLTPSNAEVKYGAAILPLPHTSSWRGA
jgi:hypothetical protein